MLIIPQTILHINSILEITCQDLNQRLKRLFNSQIELWEDLWAAQLVDLVPTAPAILTAN